MELTRVRDMCDDELRTRRTYTRTTTRNKGAREKEGSRERLRGGESVGRGNG